MNNLRHTLSPLPRANLQRGFTLIELIVVIVILGILGGYVFSYVGFGAQIYVDTTAREQLMSQSRFAVERLTREIRNAVPRSVRVAADNSCIEFMPILASSQYLQVPRQGPSASDPLLVIEPRADQGVNLIGQYLLIYASTPNFIYNPTQTERRKIIDAIVSTGDDHVVEIAYTDSISYFTGSSPAQRYFIAGQPISWCYQQTTGQLWRYTGYGLNANAATLAQLQLALTTSAEVMAENLTNDLTLTTPERPFIVDDATLVRNSLVHLDLRFARAADTERLQLLQEVHVPNVP